MGNLRQSMTDEEWDEALDELLKRPKPINLTLNLLEYEVDELRKLKSIVKTGYKSEQIKSVIRLKSNQNI